MGLFETDLVFLVVSNSPVSCHSLFSARITGVCHFAHLLFFIFKSSVHIHVDLLGWVDMSP